MKCLILSISLVSAALLTSVDAADWAVLVCGSRGWFNYRHHADVCHAYHTLINRGVPKENIITMMYDDVANDSHNPFPGKLFNRATNGTSTNAVDVYAGCKKDFTGRAVTPENFLSVLRGDDSKLTGRNTGRVLKSTQEDDVFINFVDHGAPGLVAFPNAELYAKDLIKTLQYMHDNKMYKNLVFYLEACESGSMFQDILPEGLNIFAESAANGHESSWATYCPPSQDTVNGQHLSTCLGDEYSVHWMEDTDREKSDADETLFEQFTRVRNLTKKSHVMDFGDVEKMKNDPIDDFLGEANNHTALAKALEEHIDVPASALVNSRDVGLVSKFYYHMRNPTSKVAEKEFMDELSHRRAVDKIYARIARELLKEEEEVSAALRAVAPEKPTEWECHQASNEAYKKHCEPFSDYSLKYSSTLLLLCEKLAQQNGMHTKRIEAAIISSCESHHYESLSLDLQ